MGFLTALDGDIGFADGKITVTDALDQEVDSAIAPVYARIEDEIVCIKNGTRSKLWLVERGALNSQAAGHVDGTAVVVVDPALIDRSQLPPGGELGSAEATFVEQAGAGTYVAAITVPAGATISAVQLGGITAFDADTTALDVGDADTANLFFDAEDVSGDAGKDVPADLAGAIAAGVLYSAADHVITATLTTTGVGGASGRARLLITWTFPASSVAAAYTAAP